MAHHDKLVLHHSPTELSMPTTTGDLRLHEYTTMVRFSNTRLSWNIITAPTNYNHGHGKQLFYYIIDGLYLQYPSGRPSTEMSHITPSQLWSHRISHCMLGPCCFCPLADPYAPDFVESAIYRRTESPYMGEWVATCARNKCGYFGE